MIAAAKSAPFWAFTIAIVCIFLSCSSPPTKSSRYERLIVSVPSEGFTNFETEPVRPLALAPDGRLLYALNTADDRLEIFDAQGESLRSIGETAVGLRPVALALRGDQVWLVNHLSDSVSVVDVSDPARPKVIHTLQVGDEPRGIVVAGPNRDRIFVAAAYRGETLTPGIGRAQLWIFDAARPTAPPEKLILFGSKPRALAASVDGRQVYASVYLSGNGTASVSGEDAVRLGRARQVYFDNVPYSAPPKHGPILKHSERGWRDYEDRDWSAAVPFELPDYDLFVIDAAAEQPRVIHSVSKVGTVLFNLAVQPGSGEIWVSNTEALNHIPHESRLNGRFAQNRITRVIPHGAGYRTFVNHLNPHVESVAPAARAMRELSLAQPVDLVFQPNGKEAYVAAFGSGKIGVLDAKGAVIDRITVGFGPGGLALDSRRGRLYVLNHLEATISVVDVRQRRTVAKTALRHDPTPTVIKRGRGFFYDAMSTSGFGDLSCASCHVFGDVDGLAWDLGGPVGPSIDYPAGLRSTGLAEPRQALHPLKGPMVTQTLRGLAGTAPYHWRGDRFGLPTAPGGDLESLKDFKPAFVDLLGRSEEIPDDAMDALAQFIFTIRFPPNPFQRLDRLMNGEERAGFEFFIGPFLSGAGQQNCVSCHQLPTGTNRMINFEGPQVGRDMKTAQLRNVYDKIGRFNSAGPQVAGFGLLHDGTFDTVVNFLRLEVFFFPGKSEAEKDVVRRQLHHYVMAFDSGMAPAVGRQLTVVGEPSAENRKLLYLLEIRSAAEECDLTARVWEGERQRGWLYRSYAYHADRRGQTPLETDALLGRYRTSKEPITFTCVPPGDGQRSALDREMNGMLDGDETPAAADRAAAGSEMRSVHSAR
jgi:YVTN family beta-propeller protein